MKEEIVLFPLKKFKKNVLQKSSFLPVCTAMLPALPAECGKAPAGQASRWRAPCNPAVALMRITHSQAA